MKNSLRNCLRVQLTAFLHSCSMCSQQNVDLSVVSNTFEERQANESCEVWSTLSDIGYPVISDTIPSLLLERYCYTVSYNANSRQPNWVMWQLTQDHVIGYRFFPNLEDSIKSLVYYMDDISNW